MLFIKKLFIIRHAKSSWALPGLSDFSRPLNDRGLQDAPDMANRLLLRKEAIDIFLSSPALRARQTCELFCDAYRRPLSDIQWEESLYHAPCETFYRVLEKVEDEFDSIALFSHNPGITDFVNSLHAGAMIDNMPTCGIYAVQIQTESWSTFSLSPKIFLFFDSPKMKA